MKKILLIIFLIETIGFSQTFCNNNWIKIQSQVKKMGIDYKKMNNDIKNNCSTKIDFTSKDKFCFKIKTKTYKINTEFITFKEYKKQLHIIKKQLISQKNKCNIKSQKLAKEKLFELKEFETYDLYKLNDKYKSCKRVLNNLNNFYCHK